MPGFIIKTLGCKVNQCESQTIAQSLKGCGMTELSGPGNKNADFCIINTCTVTQKASMQSRQVVRKAIRENPHAKIIVTGCYAQTEPDEIRKIKGIDFVVDQKDKHIIPDIIVSGMNRCQVEQDHQNRCNENKFRKRTRAFLKVQDGCNSFCTYCIVPYARGRSKSLPPEKVLQSIKEYKAQGYQEVVLTGVHLGNYGLDLSPQTSLYYLLDRIEKSQPAERIRLSSIEPKELTDEILCLVSESEILCNHFHIPLQSGDDKILKKMHRPYTGSYFQELVLKINRSIPDAAIGADVLVGFPGETDSAFENTYSLIEKLPIAYLHVFPFSPRKKTTAAAHPDKVCAAAIKERCKKMRDLGNIKKRLFYNKFIGKKLSALIEEKRAGKGILKGFTSNYIPVFVSGKDDLINRIIDVTIGSIDSNCMVYGNVCQNM